MSRLDSFTAQAFTLLGLGLFIIGLRVYWRISLVGIRDLAPDDYLMLVAACAYSAEMVLAYSAGAFWEGLANNSISDEERRLLASDPGSAEYIIRVNGSKTQLAGWSTYSFFLWTLKASMCAFYLRLTDGLDNFRVRIYVGFGLIAATWLAVLFSILLGCGLAFEKNWQIYPDPGNHCQPAISKIDIFVTLVLNVATDAYVMTIPTPMLRRAKLSPAKKAGLFVLFSGGVFVAAAGTLRCVLIVTDPVNGASQAGSWACRETFVAVVTTNLPVLWPFLFKASRSVVGCLLSSFSYPSSTGASSSRGVDVPDAKGAFRLQQRSWARRPRGPRTANPLPTVTFNRARKGSSHVMTVLDR